MSHAVMLLSNAFRPDPRVLKEAESLIEAGYNITIICWDRTAEMKQAETLESGVRVIRIQKIPSTYGIGARQLLHLPRFWLVALTILNHLQPDLVHCHDFDTLPAGLLWGKTHRRPVVYDAHEYYADLCKPRLHGVGGTLLYQLIRVAEGIGAHVASAVVTVDDTLGEIYHRTNQRVIIVGHYPKRTLVNEAAPVFSRPVLTLLYIGRLSVDRGLLYYADLLRQLHEQGVPARLRLAGVFTPPDEEQRLRKHCQGLEEALDIVGWIDYSQVPELLHHADVGLVILQPEPRYMAALPVKLFEYMAAGLPVVASDFAAISDVVNSAQCGALVNPLDPQAATAHIRYWWEHPDEARAAGENGRRAIMQKYNWDTLIQRLADLYSSLMDD